MSSHQNKRVRESIAQVGAAVEGAGVTGVQLRLFMGLDLGGSQFGKCLRLLVALCTFTFKSLHQTTPKKIALALIYTKFINM